MAGVVGPGYTAGGRHWPPELAANVLPVHMPGLGPDYDPARTDAQRKTDQLAFVLNTLWQLPATSGLRTHITTQGILDIMDILNYDDIQIDSMSYQVAGAGRRISLQNHE